MKSLSGFLNLMLLAIATSILSYISYDIFLGISFMFLALGVYVIITGFYNALKPRWKDITFYEGEHYPGIIGYHFSPYSCPLNKDFSTIKTYQFTEKSKYNYHNIYGKEMVNKLFGFSFGWNHLKNSARVGWRYDADKNVFNLVSLIHYNGKIITNELCDVNTNDIFMVMMEIVDNSVRYVVILSEGYDNRVLFVSDIYPINRCSKYGYKLYEYFGGKYPAIKTVTIRRQLKP